MTAVTVARPARTAAQTADYRAIWLGARPWWLEQLPAREVLDDVEPGPPSAGSSRRLVVHAAADALPTLRRASRDRLVADLCGVERLGRPARRVARTAAVVLVDEPSRLRLLGRGARPNWSLLRTPLDLERWAPEPLLRAERDAELKRFRRLHRLTAHTILYAGPYRRDGGWLHVLLAAAQLLRGRYDDLVVAAVPDGPVDARYRDECERQALALGHRAAVAWEAPAAELPLWYALATVACVGPGAPALLSAAAAVPALATVADELPRALAPQAVAADPEELAAALDGLLADPARAARLGAARRRAAEDELSPAAAARRLRAVWSGLARG